MKLTLSLDQLSPKALTAMSNLQTAIATRQGAEANLTAALKKEEQCLAQVQALGIHLTGLKSSAPVKPVEIAVPEGMLTTREAAQILGLAVSTMGKLTERGDLVVAQRVKSPQGPSVNLFRAVDVEALRLKRSLQQRAESSPQTPAKRSSPAPRSIDAAPPKPPAPAPKPVPGVESAALSAAAPPAAPAQKPTPPKVPTFDTNEEGKLSMIDHGKLKFLEQKLFYIVRLDEGKRYLWDCQPNTVLTEGWELVEQWSKTGIGRWESTPAQPGAVGMGTLTAPSGPMQGKVA